MNNYKVHVNLNFSFSTPLDSVEEINNFAQQLVEEIVEQNPSKEYKNFKILTNVLLHLKSKKFKKLPTNKLPTNTCALTHIKDFSFDEFLEIIKKRGIVKINVDGIEYKIESKQKYKLFTKGCKCVACGKEGVKITLSKYSDSDCCHFRLYSIEGGKYTLMTVDHIIPKSKKGKDISTNYQIMCEECNIIKADSDMLPSEVMELKEFKSTHIDKVGKKRLGKLVQQKRKEIINKRNNI